MEVHSRGPSTRNTEAGRGFEGSLLYKANSRGTSATLQLPASRDHKTEQQEGTWALTGDSTFTQSLATPNGGSAPFETLGWEPGTPESWEALYQ